ncbi:MAG: D-alanyl-D-alanine carboxypeptidase, partial [Acidobacteriota bacterium]
MRRLPIPCVLLALLAAPTAQADPSRTASIPGVHRYLDNGGIVVTHGGEVLYGHRSGEAFVPASTLKIATALAAIEILSLDYRFKTEFYLSPTGDLTLRGYGDPYLVSEEWPLITRALADTGALPRSIRNLYLDTSAFEAEVEIPGIAKSLDPYNASNGPLAVNFNTIHVRVEAGGRVRSAESQTPLTPTARRLGAKLRRGKHRINISRDRDVPVRYAGELAAAFLAQRGHPVTGDISTRPVTAEDRLIYTHTNSRSLEDVIAAMMEYSNNFIANQLFLVLGLEARGEPATRAKGAEVLEQFLVDEVGLDPGELEVVEGSGISRQNRITPRALARVVRAFYPYRHLLTARNGVQLKTGTLTGVYSLAGFLPS